MTSNQTAAQRFAEGAVSLQDHHKGFRRPCRLSTVLSEPPLSSHPTTSYKVLNFLGGILELLCKPLGGKMRANINRTPRFGLGVILSEMVNLHFGYTT